VELTPPRKIVEAITSDTVNPAFKGEMIMEGSTLRSEQDSRKRDKCGAVIKFLLQWYDN
jgi:hypothetical protein